MIIAIDESGDFSADSKRSNFFVALQIRQRKTLYRSKQSQFEAWEKKLPKKLKNHKGEIKSSKLSDEALELFSVNVIKSFPHIGITPYMIRSIQNPEEIVNKHRTIQHQGILKGVSGYTELGRSKMAQSYEQFGNWFKKLSYSQYLKIVVLGECIVNALVNAFGSSISAGFDDELVRLRYLIDKDFIRAREHKRFWRELLRNQLSHITTKVPIPTLVDWKKKGHSILDKYEQDGAFNLNKLFLENCEFVESHKTWEIRLSDTVNTIFSRYFNQNKCIQAYQHIKPAIIGKNKVVHQLILADFDPSSWKPIDNS